VRAQRWNLNATAAYDAKRFEDRIASTATVTPKKTNAGSLSLGGDVRDPFAANGVLVWNATQTQGRLSIDEPGARAADAATAGAQGSYRKTTLSLLYLQALGGSWTFYGSVLGQRAGKNLDSSEKFSLGGAQGVRAYPSGEAAGDEGELATLELRYAVPQWLGAGPTLLLFTDQGRSRTSRNPFAAGSNERSLGAAGFGVILAAGQDFSTRFYWAAKTRGGAATADTDRSSRVWLQAAKYF
jgi:hemolysin activation/secretion protein